MSKLSIFISENRGIVYNKKINNDAFDLWESAIYYQGICMYDENYILRPRLAENVSINDHCINVKLKKITWENGKELTSYDFLESYKANYNKKKHLTDAFILGEKEYIDGKEDEISGIEIVDDKNFKITYEGNYRYILEKLLYPVKSVDEIKGYVSKNSIGTYYKDKQNEKLYHRNINYCLGKPYIEHLELDCGNNVEQIKRLVNGQLDFTILEPSTVKKISNQTRLKYRFFALKQPCSIVLFINPHSTLFWNENLRKKISYDIDRNQIISKVFCGYADVQTGYYPSIVAQILGVRTSYYEQTYINEKSKCVIGYCEKEPYMKNIALLLKKQKICAKIKKVEDADDAFLNGCDMFLTELFYTLFPVSNLYILNKEEIYAKNKEYTKIIDLEHEIMKNESEGLVEEHMKEFDKCLPYIPILSKQEIQVVSNEIRNIRPDSKGVLWNIHEIEKET